MENLDKFLLFLEYEKGQKENTLVTSTKLVRNILNCCRPLTAENFKIFVYSLIEKKRAPSYISQFIGIARQWGECFGIPELRDYKYPKINYKSDFVRATFEDEEVHQFLKAPNLHPKGVYHDRYDMWIMFFSILFYHGCRTIEIARLQKSYIDFGRNIIMIPASISKTGDTRLIPISPHVSANLKDFIYSLPEEQDYLFPPYRNETKDRGKLHVTDSDWQGFFNKHIQRLGIKRKNLTAYSGRHTYGTRQADEDVSVFKIKAIMGHKKVETTMKYVQVGLNALRKVQNNDRLGRSTLDFASRFLLFRVEHRKLVEGYCNTPAEERQMIKDLYGV